MSRSLCKLHPDVDYKTAWGCPDCLAELRNELAAAQKDAERLTKLVDSVLDNLPYLENLILPAGHESPLLRKHPQPCVGHDFCLMHQAQKGADAIRLAIDAAITVESK